MVQRINEVFSKYRDRLQNMVQRINEVFSKYRDRLREMQAKPRLPYGRGLQRRDGAPNRMFLTCLFLSPRIGDY